MSSIQSLWKCNSKVLTIIYESWLITRKYKSLIVYVTIARVQLCSMKFPFSLKCYWSVLECLPRRTILDIHGNNAALKIGNVFINLNIKKKIHFTIIFDVKLSRPVYVTLGKLSESIATILFIVNKFIPARFFYCTAFEVAVAWGDMQWPDCFLKTWHLLRYVSSSKHLQTCVYYFAS